MSKYTPKLNDYVKWKEHIHGWVYFVDKKYITIETSVNPKDEDNLKHCSLHKNNRLLVLCYHNQWEQLELIGYRENQQSDVILPIKS